ncbi:MAG: hypothetical protein U5N55_01275 [Cypionkella sp.]|nr:hypothetical protein [Cypionkella sp.]
MPLYYVGGLSNLWTATTVQIAYNDESQRDEIVQLIRSQFASSLEDTLPSAFAIEGSDVVIGGGRTAVLNQSFYGSYDGTYSAFGGSIPLIVAPGAGDLWIEEASNLQVISSSFFTMTGDLTNEGGLSIDAFFAIEGAEILNTGTIDLFGGYMNLAASTVEVTGEGTFKIRGGVLESNNSGVTILENQSLISGASYGAISDIALQNGNLGIIEANGNFGDTGDFYIGGNDSDVEGPIQHTNQASSAL